ncbi:uncharacterized protein LOC123555916 [Mercenaria mercenaria]|uniref:uncharacterized protein LOC123555916 n=1 Tax=Mercenaria mercenaria TaxID=6596 RepID=UPI00234FB08F|nr:uncharacterized protein LOC123555916 [Mercenaria mercenaria]
METFVRCLNENKICYFRSWRKEKTVTWQCDHKFCRALLEKFIELETNTRKLKIEYDRKDVKAKYESDQCPCENTHHDADMFGTGQRCDQSENLVNANPQYGDSQVKVWSIAKLYMYGENGDGTYNSFDELDISKIVKMMSNCKLFSFDDSVRYYEKIMEFRNELMHSTNNHISGEKIADDLKETRGLLNELSKAEIVADASFCKEAIQDLQKLEGGTFAVKHQSSEYRDMVKKMFNVKTAVYELDKSIEKSSVENKRQSELLLDLLNKVISDLGGTDVGQEEKIIESEPSKFKRIVKSAVEMKKNAIKSDISECENIGESYKKPELESLQKKTDSQLEDIDQILAEPEPSEVLELASSLNKEVTAISSECKLHRLEVILHISISSKTKRICIKKATVYI